MSITMYDSIDVGQVPAGPQAVAGYVGGHWPTFAGLVAKFPKAHHLSIAVNAGERARCLDVEQGDATIWQAPGWFRSLADRSVGKPVLYCSASAVQSLINVMTASGIHRDQYWIWSAHYNFKPHVCGPRSCGYPQADATQWSDRALGRNLDQSLVNDGVFINPQPPVDPRHYDWFYNTPGKYHRDLHERDIVVHYDGARQHPIRYYKFLKTLKGQLKLLADDVYRAAHEDPNPNKTPSWDKNYRGWRYQQLIQRSQGKKLTK